MIDNIAEQQNGMLWESLTEEQRIGVLEAYEESNDESTLISLEDIVEKYRHYFK